MLQSLWLVCQAGLGLLLLNLLVTSIYRLKFHPLAKYPGPCFAKISNLHPTYYSFLGQTNHWIYQAHQKYGPIVRLGPNKLAFNTAAAMHELYPSKDVQKSQGYFAMAVDPRALNTHTVINKALHRRKRRLISQAFSEQAQRRFEPVMIEQIDVFLTELFKIIQQSNGRSATNEHFEKSNGTWSSPVDLGLRFRFLTVDVLGEFGFGQSLGLQASARNRFFIDAVDAASFRNGLYLNYAKLRKYGLELIILPLKKGLWSRFVKLRTELVTARLRDQNAGKNDLFSFLIDAKDPETGQGTSPEELFAESALFAIAGTDTTATALSATLFYLSKRPDCYKRLVSDIRNTFQHPSEVKTSSELMNLVYLRACVDEAMRLSPPAGAALWREVCNPEGTTIQGVFVPPGIDVGTSVYCVNHDEAIFPNPFAYKPERWMVGESSTTEQLEMMKWAFQPFSVGPRACAAKNMAYTELSITIAKLLLCFDIRTSDDMVGSKKEGRDLEEQFVLKEHLTAKYEGPWLQLRSRPGLLEEQM